MYLFVDVDEHPCTTAILSGKKERKYSGAFCEAYTINEACRRLLALASSLGSVETLCNLGQNVD